MFQMELKKVKNKKNKKQTVMGEMRPKTEKLKWKEKR